MTFMPDPFAHTVITIRVSSDSGLRSYAFVLLLFAASTNTASLDDISTTGLSLRVAEAQLTNSGALSSASNRMRQILWRPGHPHCLCPPILLRICNMLLL
jgi:hypothetical protein